MFGGDDARREPSGGSPAHDDDIFDRLNHVAMGRQREEDVNLPLADILLPISHYSRMRAPIANRRPDAYAFSNWLSNRPCVLNVSSVTLSASRYMLKLSVN